MQAVLKRSLNSGILLPVGLMVTNVINFLFNTVLGRTLSFDEFSIVALLATLFAITAIPLLAITATVNYRTALLGAKKLSKQIAFLTIAKTYWRKITIGAVIVWLVATPFLMAYFKIPTFWPIITYTPVIALGIVTAIHRGYLQGRLLFAACAMSMIFEAIVKLLIAIGFIGIGFQDWAYLSIPLSFILVTIFTYLLVRRLTPLATEPDKLALTFPRQFFIAALFSLFASNAFLTFDIVLIKHYFSADQAGVYALLALVGKMIFYFGSLCNTLMITYVARDKGAQKDPHRSFYVLFSVVTTFVICAYIALGLLGFAIVPILFGEKAAAIVSYLPRYAIAISAFTLSTGLVSFHLALGQYLFPITAVGGAAAMILGIALFHQSIDQVITVMQVVSLVTFFLMVLLHILNKMQKFALPNVFILQEQETV